MSGPDVAWYVAVAAVLFGIGALGVLIRRNTLVVLLSLELMLNAGNLALIALARHWHNGAGQIFALAVMAVAASEVCVGLGLVVALNRRNLSLDVLALPARATRRHDPDHAARDADSARRGWLDRHDERLRRVRRRDLGLPRRALAAKSTSSGF